MRVVPYNAFGCILVLAAVLHPVRSGWAQSDGWGGESGLVRFHTQYDQGERLVRGGRFEEALEAFRAALRIRPTAYYVHESIGDLTLRLARRREALFSFVDAVSILESDPNLGNYDIRSRIYQKLIRLLEEEGPSLELPPYAHSLQEYRSALAENERRQEEERRNSPAWRLQQEESQRRSDTVAPDPAEAAASEAARRQMIEDEIAILRAEIARRQQERAMETVAQTPEFAEPPPQVDPQEARRRAILEEIAYLRERLREAQVGEAPAEVPNSGTQLHVPPHLPPAIGGTPVPLDEAPPLRRGRGEDVRRPGDELAERADVDWSVDAAWRSVGVDPENWRYWERLGDAYRLSGDRRSAFHAYDRAVQALGHGDERLERKRTLMAD